MTGGFREKRIKNPDKPFSDTEIREFVEKASNSVKFVYKRGSFFVVDVFQREQRFQSVEEIKVSEQEMSGTIGQDIVLSDQTLPPEQYDSGLVTRKGGYTSTDAQKAREAEKPAIFSSDREEGETINPIREKSDPTNDFSERVTATEIKTIRQLETNYSSEEAYLESYSEVFGFEGEKAILDARKISNEGLVNALEYLEADVTVLMQEPDLKVLKKIVEKDFTLGVESSEIPRFESMVERAEHLFVVEKLRSMK